MMYLWARQYPVTDAMEEAEVDRRTAIDMYQWLREVCSTKLLSSPVILVLWYKLMNLCLGTNQR